MREIDGMLPQLGAKLRWEHPLTHGLVFCALRPLMNPKSLTASSTYPGDVGHPFASDLVSGEVPTCTSASRLRPIYPWKKGYSVAPDVTLEAWVWPSFVNTYTQVVGNESASPVANTGYTMLIKSNYKLASYGLNGATSQSSDGSGSAIEQYRWSHIVSVFDRVGVRQYINGKLDYANTSSGNWSAATAALGPIVVGNSNVDAANRYLLGYVALAKVYGRPLTSQEIAWLYAEPRAVFSNSNIARKYYSIPTGPPPSFNAAWARNSNQIIQPGVMA